MLFLIINLIIGMLNYCLLEFSSNLSVANGEITTPDQLSDMINDLNTNENTKNKIATLAENMIEQPVLARIFIFIMLSIPILNFVFTINLIITIINKIINK